MGASIELIGISKKYKEKEVVKSAYMKIPPGEFVTILGPSGAGKTTVLKMIAGFEKTTDGFIKINGDDITHKPTYKRNIGMLFQNYALFPHMTVEENIQFPLTIRKIPKNEIKNLVKNSLSKVRLEGYEKRYPKELSGGQQQRVALARALVFNPPILLLDEPMAALDKQLRKHMQLEVKQIQKELGITTISVTHDQEEALTMATKVCVMKDGKVMQIAGPEEIYEKPENSFVAKFIGEANLLKGKITYVDQNNAKIDIPNHNSITTSKNSKYYTIGEKAYILIRPEKIQLLRDNENLRGLNFTGTVTQAVYVGEAVKFKVNLDSGETLKVKVFSRDTGSIREGNRVKLGVDEKDMVLIKSSH